MFELVMSASSPSLALMFAVTMLLIPKSTVGQDDSPGQQIMGMSPTVATVVLIIICIMAVGLCAGVAYLGYNIYLMSRDDGEDQTSAITVAGAGEGGEAGQA